MSSRGLDAELAPLEENGDDRDAQGDQGDRRRDGDEEDEPKREGDRPFQLLDPALRHLLRKTREGGRPHGDGEDPEGKLDDPVGVVEVRDASRRQERRQDRPDEDVDLVDRRPERRGEHQHPDPLHPRMAEAEIGLQPHPHLDQKGPLHGELEHAARHDADGECDDRFPEKAPERQGGQDHREVQDDGRECRRREMAERIEDPHAERDERDEQDVGEHQPGEEDGQLVLGGHPGEARAP